MSSPVLVLAAHGSADRRSTDNTHDVAGEIRRLRPGVQVRVAFCEQATPNVRDVVAESRDAVVVPLLLADAYHARVDIPSLIAGFSAVQADVLGEDQRLVSVLERRVRELGVSRHDADVGVIVVAVGSSRPQANTRTAGVARALTARTRWRATTAFATGPHPTLDEAAHRLRAQGAGRLISAPWFIAHGRITDRVAEHAAAQAIPVAGPLGAHPLIAATVLDRYDTAVANANRLAA